MSDAHELLNDVLPTVVRHRTTRRKLLAGAAAAAGVVAGSGLLGRPSRRQTADAATLGLVYGEKGVKGARFRVDDADILNFALNLEYLEAEFYQRAANGAVLATTDISGTGTLGTVNGGTQVAFTNPIIQQYAVEIASDELHHVQFLRAALGSAAVARPSIDFTNAFTAAAVSAGVVATGGTFDPFSGDIPFLLGSYIFEDVGVTAYQGGSPYIKNPTYLTKAAGILTVEGYHAAVVRTTLFSMATASTTSAADTATIIGAANKIAAARELLSQAADGVAPTEGGLAYSDPALTDGVYANIVPANANGMTFARSFQAVLNIVYLGGFNATTQSGSGGFFPSGMNGRIR